MIFPCCCPTSRARKSSRTKKTRKLPEGTTTGVAAGGAIGGTLGLLAGIGALAIPGLGPFIAAGPIMGALAGAGAGGAVGGLVGALVGMGIPEYEAKRYEGQVKDGGILLSVHCDDSEWVGRAKTHSGTNRAHTTCPRQVKKRSAHTESILRQRDTRDEYGQR